ncbi:MAG: class I SAM-dependent methyltransferase [Humidesulfovibrio sp.]
MSGGPDVFSCGAEVFARAFGEELSPRVAERVAAYGIRCRRMAREERDGWLRKIVATLLEAQLSRAGERRLGDWENGWQENLDRFLAEPCASSLVPGYFGKYAALRLNGELVAPASAGCEHDMLAALQDWLFDAWLAKAPAVYEFGCGTGHNLSRVRRANPEARLYGCDWAGSSNRLVEAIGQSGLLGRVAARRFNIFEPDAALRLEPGAAVYTVASLEQVGEGFRPFLDYLEDNRPSVCVHIEPVAELLDPKRLLDYLSIRYFEKRGYLSGFLDELRRREALGRVEILKAQRTNVGSLFIEGYSTVVWRPR